VIRVSFCQQVFCSVWPVSYLGLLLACQWTPNWAGGIHRSNAYSHLQ